MTHTVTGPAVETLVVPIPEPDSYGCLTGDCPHHRGALCVAAMTAECPYQPGDVVEFRPKCDVCGASAVFHSERNGVYCCKDHCMLDNGWPPYEGRRTVEPARRTVVSVRVEHRDQWVWVVDLGEG